MTLHEHGSWDDSAIRAFDCPACRGVGDPLVRNEQWLSVERSLHGGSRAAAAGGCRPSGTRFLPALRNVLLVYAVQLRLCLSWKAPQSLGGEEIHVAVITGLHRYDSHDFDSRDTGLLDDLVDEAMGCAVSSRTEVDLATVGEVAVGRQQLEGLPGYQSVCDKANECACSDIESWCILGKTSDVLPRSLRHGEGASSYTLWTPFQEVSPRSRRS